MKADINHDEGDVKYHTRMKGVSITILQNVYNCLLLPYSVICLERPLFSLF